MDLCKRWREGVYRMILNILLIALAIALVVPLIALIGCGCALSAIEKFLKEHELLP